MVKAYNLNELYTWVYASYGGNHDLKSHTVNGITFGYVIVHYNYRKKFEYKSSTEANIVSASH